MLEGLWSVELGITEAETEGAGVVVFENQRIMGGSGDYFYTGKYEVIRGIVQGEVQVNFCGRKHSPIFRPLTKFRMRLSGRVQRRVMMLENYVAEDQKKTIFLRLTKRADLF